MGDISEYMKAVLIISASFITVAGIVLAFGSRSEMFSKDSKRMLIFSILFGAVAMVTVLSWLDTPSSLLGLKVSTRTLKIITEASLFVQFFLWFFPLISLFPAVGRVKIKNDDSKQGAEKNRVNVTGIDVGKELLEIKDLIISYNKKVDMIEERQRKTAWQWPSAFALTGLWIGYNIFKDGRPEDQIPSFIIIGISLTMFMIALIFKRK